jgi:MoaA/NifB/PqqE/SkfB family radical SAM enzyme
MALDQVFLYVTQKCNIRCITCYALDQLERDDDLPLDDLLVILHGMREQGAWKLSFLGGEPTVHPALTGIATAAHAMGYRFVRVNTNGMFKTAWLDAPATRSIDAICFSIDGATAAINDAIRKGARFDRVIANLRHAASVGYDVRANMTVTSRNAHQVFDVMRLVEDCGGREINLNVMFEMGYASGRSDLGVAPQQWLAIYDEVLRRQREFTIRIKVPPAFTAPADIARHRADGHRCLAVDGSRTYVASNGDAYPCLAMMDQRANRTSEYLDGALAARAPSWQSAAIDDSVHDYCHFIKMRSDGLKPLCIFHKTRCSDG